MSLFKQLNFWLTAITIASLGIGVLSVFLTVLALREPEPAVVFETISETNVFDLRRSLEDLSVIFRGQDVQQQNLNLRILTLNIKNSGDVDILTSYFDQEDNRAFMTSMLSRK